MLALAYQSSLEIKERFFNPLIEIKERFYLFSVVAT